ncbi:MAG: DUF1684 domain-containing protein [Pseudomonadota bacterium]
MAGIMQKLPTQRFRPGLAYLSSGLLALLSLTACGGDALDPVAYEAAVMEWREDRLARLRSETGYLNLAGLYWLEPGESSFGGADGNDLVFPVTDTPTIGRFVLSDDGVQLIPADGVDIRYEGIPVRALRMSDDTSDNPVTVQHGRLAWGVIKREGRYGVRLRDLEHPAIFGSPPLEYFPVNPDYRVIATLDRFEEPRVLNLDTVVEGLGWAPESPGMLQFELAGESYELEAYSSDDRLFVVFADRTSGEETYPAGRFVYADGPAENGRTVLDFNLAYSPPCAFNDFSTCPIAAPGNRLPVSIAAGEKYSPEQHTAAQAH